MALPCHWMILDISTDGTLQLTKQKITTKCCSSVWPSSISSSSSKSSKPTCSILRSFRKPLFILSLETSHPRENSKDLKSNWTISFKFQANACMSNHNEPYLGRPGNNGEVRNCGMQHAHEFAQTHPSRMMRPKQISLSFDVSAKWLYLPGQSSKESDWSRS